MPFSCSHDEEAESVIQSELRTRTEALKNGENVVSWERLVHMAGAKQGFEI